MKILMVDKYHFIKGGAERYVFELAKVLEANGHEVIHFSMQDERNFPSEYEEYFINNINYNQNGFKKITNGLSAVPKMFFSLEAQKKLEQLIKKTGPEIAHVHMIDHQLSPSILYTLKKYKIPVIQTVHQYKLVCPNYKLYNPRTNQICEKCMDKRYIHAALERCHKNSFVASLLISFEMYFHKFFQMYEKNIDLFHVPSRFMGTKLEQGGINPERIKHLFYTINVDDFKFHPDFESYFVYFGRLSKEKGIFTLLKALRKIDNCRLKIIGDGPEEGFLKQYVAENKLKNVEFVGKLEGQDLLDSVSKAMFIVVPSEWFDNSPLVIYEAFAMGKPVIGSRAGGISELIDDGDNGFLFEMGNAHELEEKIRHLLQHPELVKQFSHSARAKAMKFFSPDQHYKKMLSFYKHLVNGSN